MNNYLITNPFATEVKNAAGVVVMRSKNLRAMTRYAAVSPVVEVRAHPCPLNPHNGRVTVRYSDGCTSSAFFSSHTVLIEWLTCRVSWRAAQWDVDASPAKQLNDREIRALEKLHAKGLY